ncbi:MAG: signal peptidase I [Alphaproteobacteria bacterium]|nr:signal peptidase I [Alphaproteobacteria bacterium]
MRVKPRRWWWAALLSLAGLGTAYLYVGRPWRALALAATFVVWVGVLWHGLWGFAVSAPGVLLLVAAFILMLVVPAVDGIRLARLQRDYRLRWYNRWWVYLGAIGASVAGLTAMAHAGLPGAFAVRWYHVPSASNEPTLMAGDVMLADMRAYADAGPERGDMVVFHRADGVAYVKRVIGLPGDRIAIEEGVLILNGAPVPRERTAMRESAGPPGYVSHATLYRETLPNGVSYEVQDSRPLGQWDTMAARVVGDDAYFVLGDNRDNSIDSRMTAETYGMGDIPRARMDGKARWVLWSGDLGRIGVSLAR